MSFWCLFLSIPETILMIKSHLQGQKLKIGARIIPCVGFDFDWII